MNLRKLLGGNRRETGISLRRIHGANGYRMTERLNGKDMPDAAPQVACFVKTDKSPAPLLEDVIEEDIIGKDALGGVEGCSGFPLDSLYYRPPCNLQKNALLIFSELEHLPWVVAAAASAILPDEAGPASLPRPDNSTGIAGRK